MTISIHYNIIVNKYKLNNNTFCTLSCPCSIKWNPHYMVDIKQSFSIEKRSGKKCYMIAARALTIEWGDTPMYWKWISLPQSRFAHLVVMLSFNFFFQ